MGSLKEKLKGYKTHILIAIAIIAVWLDVFLGLGLSSSCAGVEECSISTTEAVQTTWALLTGSAIKASLDRK